MHCLDFFQAHIGFLSLSLIEEMYFNIPYFIEQC